MPHHNTINTFLSGQLKPKRRSTKRSFAPRKTLDVNRLIPSKSQVRALNKLDIGPQTTKEWHDAIWYDRDENNVPIIFGAFPEKHRKNALEDQLVRANAIIDRMVEQGLTRLITLDGHGRLLWCIIHSLIVRNIDYSKWTIEVPDIDQNAHDWHKGFLPNDVFRIPENTVSILSLEKYSPKYTKGCFIYMNFCGLGNHETRNEVLNFIHSLAKPAVMLSVSIRSKCKENETKDKKVTTRGVLETIRKKYNSQNITERGTFVTIGITPSVSYARRIWNSIW